ncbi:MAG: hypothetical protein ACR2JB_14460 [Bryobacteraceae bacterium]
MAHLRRAPHWAVPVKLPFATLVLSGACPPKKAWRLSRGALVSPFHQSVILNDVREWRIGQAIRKQFVLDVITLPFALW